MCNFIYIKLIWVRKQALAFQAWEPEIDPQNSWRILRVRCDGWCLAFSHWECREQGVPGAPWPDTLSYLVSTSPVRKPVLKKEGDGNWRTTPELSFGLHMHGHVCAHALPHVCACLTTKMHVHKQNLWNYYNKDYTKWEIIRNKNLKFEIIKASRLWETCS